MQSFLTRPFLTIALGVCVAAGAIPSSGQVGSCTSPTVDAYLDVGNVRARIFNNGSYVWRRDEEYVYEVPKGSGINSVFAATFLIGGYVEGELRVAAARYGNYQFWPGPIDDAGNPPSDCSDYDRIWNIYRSDIERYEAGKQPTPDLIAWPTGLGAPTVAPAYRDGTDNDTDSEVDERGEVRRVHDELLRLPLAQRANRVIDLEAGERPEMIGDQMLWWIMNDAGGERRFDELPIGIEVHGTAFAFDVPGDLGNTTFYRKRLFVRRSASLDSAFVSVYADTDLGNFQDDYVGSDTTLGFGFTYNADDDDEHDPTDRWLGYGGAPPAVAVDFVRGPLVRSPGDSVLVVGRTRHDTTALDMTSFVYIDEYLGFSPNPILASDYYHTFHGHFKTGSPFTEGRTGLDPVGDPVPMPFMFPGDPISRSFWSEYNVDREGRSHRPGDRHMYVSSGPFRVDDDGRQEVIYGILWARGESNLDSIVQLRDADRRIQAFVDNGFTLPQAIDRPKMTASPLDQSVVIEWRGVPSSNNEHDDYVVHHALASPDDPWVRFEGYEIWQFAGADDSTGTLIATYDVENGVMRVDEDLDGDGFLDRTTRGRDSGIRHVHRVSGLTNYRSYYFGVRAYAYARDAPEQIRYSDFARASAVPAPPSAVVSDAALEASLDDASPDFIATQVAGSGTGAVWADAVNPVAMRDGTYRIGLYTFSNGAITYDISRDNSTVFDGSAAGIPAPQREHVFVADGLEFSVVPDSAGGFQPGDVFEFSTAGYGATEPDLETQRARLDEIGIVPNPYKAFSDYEVDLANDEVRFTGLPDVATIRVFTLHGTLVRTLEKDSPGLRSLSWDVRNEDGRKLASGMYLIHVDVPGVGERVIKFGMVKDGVVE